MDGGQSARRPRVRTSPLPNHSQYGLLLTIRWFETMSSALAAKGERSVYVVACEPGVEKVVPDIRGIGVRSVSASALGRKRARATMVGRLRSITEDLRGSPELSITMRHPMRLRAH